MFVNLRVLDGVALRKESVDRNGRCFVAYSRLFVVALRKESVDRNQATTLNRYHFATSLSARRAWIEIPGVLGWLPVGLTSLSARRAWIEIE